MWGAPAGGLWPGVGHEAHPARWRCAPEFFTFQNWPQRAPVKGSGRGAGSRPPAPQGPGPPFPRSHPSPLPSRRLFPRHMLPPASPELSRARASRPADLGPAHSPGEHWLLPGEERPSFLHCQLSSVSWGGPRLSETAHVFRFLSGFSFALAQVWAQGLLPNRDCLLATGHSWATQVAKPAWSSALRTQGGGHERAEHGP